MGFRLDDARFLSHPECTQCPLYEQARTPGMATRRADCPPSPTGEQALLVVGEAPGLTEDTRGRSWIGRAGGWLHKAFELASLPEHADIYLANACRCRPPQNDTPTKTQIDRCRAYLDEDLRLLFSAYEGRLTVLALGATASRSLFGKGVTDGFHAQGSRILVPLADGRMGLVPLFFAYHPAYILRQPSAVTTMRDHFAVVHRWLARHAVAPALHLDLQVDAEPPSQWEGPLAVDIETYGALRGREQTQFHPVKMACLDGVEPERQVQTVALSCKLPGDRVFTTAFPYDGAGVRRLLRWLDKAAQQEAPLLFQNGLFDLSVLRASHGLMRYALDPRRLRLEELMLWNFLQSELRPERSLKALSSLFAIAHYKADNFSAASPRDPALLEYNGLDTAVTLIARDLLLEQIEGEYGPQTAKLSSLCRDHMNAVMWSCLAMLEAGITYDVGALQKVHAHYMARTARCEALSEATFQVPLAGKGSGKATQELFDRLLDELGLAEEPDVLRTSKTREVSTSKSNIYLFRQAAIAQGHREAIRRLNLLYHHRRYQKIASTYSSALLNNPAQGIVQYKTLPDGTALGHAYPLWFPCPSRFQDEDPDSESGTVQARFTCRYPVEQIHPPAIQRCRRSRFPHGSIYGIDYSQIELRVSALLSGDPVALQEYAEGIDRHAQTGRTVADMTGFGADRFDSLLAEHGKKHPSIYLYRQAGKTTNFLITFEGQAEKLRATLLRMTGLNVGIPACQAIINWFDDRYRVTRQWQSDTVARVLEQGYDESITGWSRTFLGTPRDRLREKAKIINRPVQTFAAQLLQSAVYRIFLDLLDHKARSVICLNIHDAAYLDVHPAEQSLVDGILARRMPRPPLLIAAEKILDRTVPLEYDVDIK